MRSTPPPEFRGRHGRAGPRRGRGPAFRICRRAFRPRVNHLPAVGRRHNGGQVQPAVHHRCVGADGHLASAAERPQRAALGRHGGVRGRVVQGQAGIEPHAIGPRFDGQRALSHRRAHHVRLAGFRRCGPPSPAASARRRPAGWRRIALRPACAGAYPGCRAPIRSPGRAAAGAVAPRAAASWCPRARPRQIGQPLAHHGVARIFALAAPRPAPARRAVRWADP